MKESRQIPWLPIRGSSLSELAFLFLLATGWNLDAAETPLPELRNAQEIRQLSAGEASRRYPVRLQGVLTFLDQRTQFKAFRFLQDDTAGIYFYPPGDFTNATIGERVEVEGHTSQGEFAPVVDAERIQVLGPGIFPPATPVTFQQLSSGQEDSQFVSLRGVVRAVRMDDEMHYFVLDLATGEGQVTVRVSQLPVKRSEDLIDSTIQVQGVCFTEFNRQRQLFNFGLLVPRPQDLVIVEPAPADPFATTAQPVKSLLLYRPQGADQHRLKVTGTVTLRYGDRLFIQDDGAGLCVQTRQTNPLAIGDRVEVLGFPVRGGYTPAMEDGIYRRIAAGSPVVPVKVSVDDALKGYDDSCLVTIEATLIDRAQHSQEPFLVLQAGGFVFHAYLHGQDDTATLQSLQNGSKLSVTGVCLIEAGQEWYSGPDWRAASFRILMRDRSDIVVRQLPPWWTLRKLLWATGILIAAVLGAFAWVVNLRRRVRQQTVIIEEKLQAEAALKERFLELVENANDVVFTHDLQGHLTSINSTGERLLQRTREDLIAVHLLDLMAKDQRPAAARWLDSVLKGADLPAVEWAFLNASGQLVKLEINSRVIVQNGKQIEVEGIGRDITERKRLEKEILEISSKEQRRIGQDLHDGVCQQLAAIAYRIHGLARRLQDKALPESTDAESIGELITESLKQTRGVARGLFPVSLEEDGLVSALEELTTNTANRFKIKCDFSSEGPPPAIDNSVAVHVYYIAQEAILNAARHGKAQKIAVDLKRSQDRLVLSIQDDGVGFEPATARPEGMGIAIMNYRARVISANLDLKSSPGHGTQLVCSFQPLTQKPAEKSYERK